MAVHGDQTFHTILSYGNLQRLLQFSFYLSPSFHTILSYGNWVMNYEVDEDAELPTFHTILSYGNSHRNVQRWTDIPRRNAFHTILSYGNW